MYYDVEHNGLLFHHSREYAVEDVRYVDRTESILDLNLSASDCSDEPNPMYDYVE